MIIVIWLQKSKIGFSLCGEEISVSTDSNSMPSEDKSIYNLWNYFKIGISKYVEF